MVAISLNQHAQIDMQVNVVSVAFAIDKVLTNKVKASLKHGKFDFQVDKILFIPKGPSTLLIGCHGASPSDVCVSVVLGLHDFKNMQR